MGIGKDLQSSLVSIKELQSPICLSLFIDTIDLEFFHPTLPITWVEDAYCGIYDGERLIALGFLRGWDAGWDNICLGIAVLPEYRQRGHAERLCRYLEYVAQRRELKKIRLHVHPNNAPALKLYEKLGYEGTDIRENGELIMYKDLRCE